MIELVNILTKAEVLLESNMLGTLIGAYIYLFLLLFVSFLNIYSVDKYEFLNNIQFDCIKFNHKMFFVIMYSKDKCVVSKKTLITESIGYLIAIISIVVLICSLKQTVTTSFILLGIIALLICAFGWVTGSMYGKTKQSNKRN